MPENYSGTGQSFQPNLIFSKSCPFKHIILEYMQALYDLNSFVCYSAIAFSLFKKINNFVNRKRPKMGASFQCQCLFSKNKFPSTIEFYLPINLCMLFRIWIDKSQMMTWKNYSFSLINKCRTCELWKQGQTQDFKWEGR